MKYLRRSEAGVVLLVILMCVAFYVVSAWAATGTITRSIEKNGPYTVFKWCFVEDGGAAEDSAETYTITGKVVGVKFVETSITAGTVVELTDSAGRDVLQGLFGSTDAVSTSADAANHFRVPVDSTSGGYIYLFDEAVSATISSGSTTDTGCVEVIVDTQ